MGQLTGGVNDFVKQLSLTPYRSLNHIAYSLGKIGFLWTCFRASILVINKNLQLFAKKM
jgi:hypothetical protein